MKKQKTIPKKEYAFRDAYDSLPRKKQQILRANLSRRLEINRESFYGRMNGIIPLYPEFLIIKEEFQKMGIEKVFAYERDSIEAGEGDC